MRMPATSRPLPVMQTVVTAYGDVWRALRAMRMLFAAGLLIVLAIGVAEDLIPPPLWKGAVTGTLFGFAADVIKSFCLAPMLIAIHRFIILDEITPGYAPDPAEPGFMMFFGWLVALSAAEALVFLLPDILGWLGVPPFAASIAFFVALAAMLVVAMRLSILFPAIAIQAPGAHLAQAIADSRGRLVRTVLAFVLTVLPCAAAAVLVTIMFGRGAMKTGSMLSIVSLIIGALITTVMLWLCAAVASRLFQAFGQRLLRPVRIPDADALS
jgi:hypothetical protein